MLTVLLTNNNRYSNHSLEDVRYHGNQLLVVQEYAKAEFKIKMMLYYRNLMISGIELHYQVVPIQMHAYSLV